MVVFLLGDEVSAELFLGLAPVGLSLAKVVVTWLEALVEMASTAASILLFASFSSWVHRQEGLTAPDAHHRRI